MATWGQSDSLLGGGETVNTEFRETDVGAVQHSGVQCDAVWPGLRLLCLPVRRRTVAQRRTQAQRKRRENSRKKWLSEERKLDKALINFWY